MKCPICGSEKWLDMDDLRNHQYWWENGKLKVGDRLGFQACRDCGFVTYERRGTEEEMHAYYKSVYRAAVGPSNWASEGRRNEYRKRMLKDVLAGSPRRMIDIGCAAGLFPRMFREEYGWPNEMLAGVEPTDGYREYAKHEIGLDVREKIEEFKGEKFGLVVYYRVLEHVWNPVGELLKAREILEDDGILYGSVPRWGEVELDDPTTGVDNDIESYYHKDHINVFTDNSMRSALAVAGYEIVTFDTTVHGISFLARKGKVGVPIREDAEKFRSLFKRQKEAMRLVRAKNPQDAIKEYPLYPDAHMMCAFWKENMRDEKIQKGILDDAIKLMPGCVKMIRQRALIELQWAQAPQDREKRSEAMRIAGRMLDEADAVSPGMDDHWHHKAYIAYMADGDIETACRHWKRGIAVNPLKWEEYGNYIGLVRAGKPLKLNTPPSRGDEPGYSGGVVQMVGRPKFAGMAQGMGAGLGPIPSVEVANVSDEKPTE